jgi:histidyl-tRNA synthetase
MSSLTFPFRRYQIGKVYRGERNQKGRFREFYQCDIDIIGNGKLSIINDAEIPSVIYSTFKGLGFESFTIHINNRKILNGFFDSLGAANKMDILRIIDKIDKIGVESVKSELAQICEDKSAVDKIIDFINIKGSNDEIIENLKKLNIVDAAFNEGVDELSKVVYYIHKFGVPDSNYVIDLRIARGLDYYTGTVYETILNDYPGIGSVCSGGRYDNLSEYYTSQKLPGVGISIGLTRLFYQLKEAGFFSGSPTSYTEALVIPLDGNIEYAIDIVNKLRENNIISGVYFEETKTPKKLSYADKLGIHYAILLGEEEVKSGLLTLKDMRTGEQNKLQLSDVIKHIAVR